jgi:hypothetical protein
LKFLALFAEVDGVRIFRAPVSHATQCASAARARASYRGVDPPVNEFYKKECQEKSSAATGAEILSRDPAHCSLTSVEKVLSILVSFLC